MASSSDVSADTTPQPTPAPVAEEKPEPVPPVAKQSPPPPEHVPYVLIGAGTASFACMKAIRERDPNAKVFILLYNYIIIFMNCINTMFACNRCRTSNATIDCQIWA